VIVNHFAYDYFILDEIPNILKANYVFAYISLKKFPADHRNSEITAGNWY
jgi:hypothetical protein